MNYSNDHDPRRLNGPDPLNPDAAQPHPSPRGEAGHAPCEQSEADAPRQQSPRPKGAHAPRASKSEAPARTNGRKSRGPITPGGIKARSSRNAVTHGSCAKDVVLLFRYGGPRVIRSSPLRALRSPKPLNPVAEKLAEAIVSSLAGYQSRIWEVETALPTDATECHDDELTPAIRLSRAFRTLSEEPCLHLLDRYETRYERQFARAIRLCRQINESDPDFFQTNPSAPLPPQPPVEPPQPEPASQAAPAPDAVPGPASSPESSNSSETNPSPPRNTIGHPSIAKPPRTNQCPRLNQSPRANPGRGLNQGPL